MPGRLEFELGVGGRPTAPRPVQDGAMRLLLLGDFSGRPAVDRPALAERPTHRVDIDNLDTVLARLAPRAVLPGAEIAFAGADDFHPDALYRRLPLFQALRDARQQPPAAGGDLLGALLGSKPAAPATPAPAAQPGGIDAFIRAIVAPHIVTAPAGGDAAYLAAVDAASAEKMRAVLHAPAFQALEAAWHGVDWLVRNLELDQTLQLHLFDASRVELMADVVAAGGQPAQTGLHRALVDRWRNVPGAAGWTLLAGLFSFGPNDADIGLLAALGLIARAAGAPFVAAANAALAGAPAFTGWQALRTSEAAAHIGLATPRLLLRLPYGRRSDPVDAFAFEEFAGEVPHEHFLWGNPALAVGLLVGRAFSARGWDYEPDDDRTIEGLPGYTVEDADGDRQLQPCAEHHTDDVAAQALLQAGLMPLLSHRGAAAATLLRLQSVAAPARPLAWKRR